MTTIMEAHQAGGSPIKNFFRSNAEQRLVEHLNKEVKQQQIIEKQDDPFDKAQHNKKQ